MTEEKKNKTIIGQLLDLPAVKRMSILAQAIANRRRPVLEFIQYSIEKRVKKLTEKNK